MKRRVTVVGVGVARVAADAVEAHVGVSVTRPSPAEALRAATESYEAMLAVLRDAGVPPERVSTTGVQVTREWNHREGAGDEIRMNAGITLAVRLATVDAAGAVVERLVDAGGAGATVHGLTPVVEDRTAAEAQARDAAFADAHRRAEQYARLAGTTLGDVVELREGGPTGWVEQSGGMMLAASGGGPPIQGGGLAVTASVTATWELAKPAR